MIVIWRDIYFLFSYENIRQDRVTCFFDSGAIGKTQNLPFINAVLKYSKILISFAKEFSTYQWLSLETLAVRKSQTGWQNYLALVKPITSKHTQVLKNDQFYLAYFSCSSVTNLGVSQISPTNGSAQGGSKLRIVGNYFSNSSGQVVKVNVGNDTCNVISVSQTVITCQTSKFTGGNQTNFHGRLLVLLNW